MSSLIVFGLYISQRYFGGMPTKRPNDKGATIILRISDGLKRRAVKAADSKGRTLSGYIRRLIEKDTA